MRRSQEARAPGSHQGGRHGGITLCFAQSPEGVYSLHCDQDQKDDPWWADVEMLAAMVTFFYPKGNFLLWFYSAGIRVLLDHGDKFRAGEFLREKVRAL